MASTQTQCPECRTLVDSAEGFAPGQTVLCPKCETYFTAEPPGSAAPRKQPARPAPMASGKRPRKKFSIVNAVVALVLLLIIAGGVYSFVAFRNQEADKRERDQAERDANPAKMNGPISDGPSKKDGKNRKDRTTAPKKTPGSGPDTPAELQSVVSDVSGKSPAPTEAQKQQQIARLRPQLIGTWKSKPGPGMLHIVEYRADGTYRDEITTFKGRVLEGKWEVTDIVGKKGLRLKRTGTIDTTVRVIFEGGELIHDADQPGTTVVFVKS